MSGSRVARGAQGALEDDEDGQGASGGAADTDRAAIEARARVQGWKPLTEFRGDPAVWRDAEEFVARGEQELPVLRERLRSLEGRTMRAEKAAQDGLVVISDVSERLRKADERAMARAMRLLEEKRKEAVETGDVAAFNAADAEMAELRKQEEAPPAQRQAQPAVPPRADAPPQEAITWAAANPWFTAHDDLREVATNIHQRLLVSEPSLTLEQNLARVTEAVRAMYPGRVPAATRRAAERAAEPEDDPDREDPEVTRRRGQAAPVAPSRERAPRRAGGSKSFDAMPAESREAFVRYAAMIASRPSGASQPLTKEEWARDYWAQFEE